MGGMVNEEAAADPAFTVSLPLFYRRLTVFYRQFTKTTVSMYESGNPHNIHTQYAIQKGGRQ
jgi:hypothetical protein